MCGALPPTLFDFLYVGTWSNGGQDTGYPVHRCVCMSVYMCISVSSGVPVCILGVKKVTFWGIPGTPKIECWSAPPTHPTQVVWWCGGMICKL